MGIGMKDIVRFGKETTRGTAASSLPLHHPFHGNGLVPTNTHDLGDLPTSSSWPYSSEQVTLGASASLQFEPDINVATIRDIILMACRNATGDLPSLTIGHSQSGVGDKRYLGCVCSQLELNFSRSGGNADASSILQGSMSFECMKPDDASGIVAGTQAAAHKFQMRFSQVTVNGVTSNKIRRVRIAMTNDLDLGLPDANNVRDWLHEGLHRGEASISADFDTEAWLELVQAGTQYEAELVLGTGTSDETVTATMNVVRSPNHTIDKGGVETLQEITLSPYHDGTNAPIVWGFGSGIGSSQLGLT